MSKGVVKRSFTFGGVEFPAKRYPWVNIGGVDFNLKTGDLKEVGPTELKFGSPTGINQESGMRQGYSDQEWINVKKERNL